MDTPTGPFGPMDRGGAESVPGSTPESGSAVKLGYPSTGPSASTSTAGRTGAKGVMPRRIPNLNVNEMFGPT